MDGQAGSEGVKFNSSNRWYVEAESLAFSPARCCCVICSSFSLTFHLIVSAAYCRLHMDFRSHWSLKILVVRILPPPLYLFILVLLFLLMGTKKGCML